MAQDIIKYNRKTKRWEWLRGTNVIASSVRKDVLVKRHPEAKVVD